MTAFEKMSAAELRHEADRRELMDRAKGLRERHVARLRLVEELFAIGRELAEEAKATDVMRAAVQAIVNAEKAETPVTNGQIAMLTDGPDDHWWDEFRAENPRGFPDLLDEIERGRRGAWSP